jgi:hypothetical protein
MAVSGGSAQAAWCDNIAARIGSSARMASGRADVGLCGPCGHCGADFR